MTLVERVTLYHTRFPLRVPYELSSGTLRAFDPIIVEVGDAHDRSGWGEVLIVHGYTFETVEGTWQQCRLLAQQIAGRDMVSAAALARAALPAGPGAASAFLAALEMLARDPMLLPESDVRVPLLAPCQAHEAGAIADEVDHLVGQGYRTLKVKVGYEWRADLERVRLVQQAADGRATLRLDANRGYGADDGRAFGSRLEPQGIELFEQPCAADDWAANAAVAAVSTVPLMLDESIYGVADIDRAAAIDGVGFVKLKLKKIGGLSMLDEALARIRAVGLTPVLGDGVAIDIACWMEACVAARSITNAGEMNGFLKVRQQLFAPPLQVSGGSIVLRAGDWPQVDRDVLTAHTHRSERFEVRASACAQR